MIHNIRLINNYLIAGIIGSCIVFYGYFQEFPKTYYLTGSFLLFLTAVHYRLTYFIALEVILASGHMAILLGLDQYTQMSLPFFLCFQLLIFYLMMGKENTIFLMLGIIGIALHSLGFSYDYPWIFFLGSTSIAIYAYYVGYKEQAVAYLWAILNTLFALSALYTLFINF